MNVNLEKSSPRIAASSKSTAPIVVKRGRNKKVQPVVVAVKGSKFIPPPQSFVAYSRVSGTWRSSLCRISPMATTWFLENLNAGTLDNNTVLNTSLGISIYESNPHPKKPYPQLYLSITQLNKLKQSLINFGVEPEKVHSTFSMAWVESQNATGQGMKKALFKTGKELVNRHLELLSAMPDTGSRSNSTSRESSPRLPISKLSIKGTASTSNSTPSSSTSNSGIITPSILDAKYAYSSSSRLEAIAASSESARLAAASTSNLVPAVKAFAKRSNSLLESTVSTPSTSHESSPEPFLKKVKTKLEIAELEAKDKTVLVGKKGDLELCRRTYEEAFKNGGAAFLALDIETWERQHGALLEFGWSFVDCEKRIGQEKLQIRREDQHIIIKENLNRRNGKFSPDARDHFDFGTSIVLSEAGLYTVLHALLETLSSSTPLFLLLHDDRSDLKSLHQIGFDTDKFLRTLSKLTGKDRNNIFIVDTQKLYAAWIDRNLQVRLSTCCETLEVPTRRLHNAGNDAHYTLEIFERLMDRSRIVPPNASQPVVPKRL